MATAAVGSKRSFAAMTGLRPEDCQPQKQLYSVSNSPSRSSTPNLQSTEHTGRNSSAISRDQAWSRTFDPEASLILVGARGTGKSSLGVIAATSFQRRLVDTDYAFQQMTGVTTTAYRKSYGSAQYQHKASDVLETILKTHSSRSVIVCGVLSLTRGAQTTLARYAQTHPIVHVIRDAQSIQNYLNIDLATVKDMVHSAESLYRTCSNLEFYNASNDTSSQDAERENSSSGTSRHMAPRLILKKTERCFLNFLSYGTNIQDSPALDRVFPLSQVQPHSRPHTCAMSLPANDLAHSDVDVEKFDEGVDAFELRVQSGGTSLNDISKAVAKLRRCTIVPMIYHVCRIDTGSEHSSHSRYLHRVNHGIRLASAYATLDLELPDTELSTILHGKGKTKLIADLHVPDTVLKNWLDDFWIDQYQRAQRLGFDLVRFSRAANSMEDNFQIQVLRSRISELPGPHLPLIAHNTGLLGRTSACLNPVLQPVTHADWPGSGNGNSPYTTAIDTTKALFSSFVFEPLNFYILGASSAYSLSPVMHNAAYRACGMSHHYSTFQTSHLNELRTLINDPRFGGCSISLPFKLEVINLMHSISSHAKAIGAINTVIALREVDGRISTPDDLAYWKARNRAGPVKALYGENTDWIGIRACVRRGLSPANAVSPRTTVLIVGAGGMARAAVYGMLQLGVRNVVIFNRTKSNAEKLMVHYQRLLEDKAKGRPSPLTMSVSNDLPVRFSIIDTADQAWPEGYQQPTIIVSCIPTHRIGDNPSPEFTLPESWLQSPTGGVVMEVAYRNIRTPLLQQIRGKAAQGWITMDGLDLLPDQAFAQFELFTGKRAPRRLMRGEVLKGYRDEEGRPDPDLIEQRLAQINDQDP